VARELADVLHYFLGEAPAAERGGAAGVGCLALLAEPDELLGLGALWNLAHELSRRGVAVAWVGSLDDEELLPADATPGLTRLLAPARGLEPLAGAAREAGAKLAEGRAPGLVLLRVPPSWLEPGAAAEQLLGWALLLSAPEPEPLGETLARITWIAGACPGARVGVTVHGVRSVREAEAAYAALAAAARERLDAPLWSYGLILQDAELYGSLLARRPLSARRPESAALRSLRDVARLVHEDLAAHAG
jgi:hypothetical protein